MSFYQIFLCRCYTKFQWKILCFTLFLCLICNCAVFCKKQLHLCARHAVSAACCGWFLQKTRVFSVCFGARLQGVVTNRWGRAACFLTIPGWCCRFWIEGLNIGNVPHVFLCVCMPSTRCIMLRIVGWGVYAFSACWPVRTGVAWLCGAQKRLLAWLIPDFSGIFCIIFRVRRGFLGWGILCRCFVWRCRDPAFAYATIHTRRYYAVA